ncbi:MAG: hypothetical protein ACRES3_09445 [Steroidobacteraceae bacterium]
MDDATHAREFPLPDGWPESRQQGALPPLSNAERAFWRRAVEIERARQGRVCPAPFPFQES